MTSQLDVLTRSNVSPQRVHRRLRSRHGSNGRVETQETNYQGGSAPAPGWQAARWRQRNPVQDTVDSEAQCSLYRR
jgi:hypothetical protein